MSTYPPIATVLRDRTTYGFLTNDADEDVIAIIEAEDHISTHDLAPSDPVEIARWEQSARDYSVRKTVTFKAQESVLSKFRQRAMNEGIPYQTLLNSVMKKYAEGSLVQKEEMYVVR